MSATAAVILAAGASRRMGRPKALLPTPSGETFLQRMVRIFRGASCDPVVVVTPPGGEHWLPPQPGVRIAVNPDPDRGMLSSLQCGLAALPAGVGQVLFTPMDLPMLREETIAAVLAAASRAEVVIPRIGETRGHPVACSAAVVAELAAADPLTANPKDVLRRDDARVLFLDLDDPGAIRDVDEPKDYEDLLRGSAASPAGPAVAC